MSTSPSSLPLRDELLAALDQLGFTELTPVQVAALPPLLEGLDVRAQAATGSGKTLAFGLALLQRVEPAVPRVQALVVCPTRELAAQVAAVLRQLARGLPHTRVQVVCGGSPVAAQAVALSRGVQVVVGTPGRLGKHLRDGALDLTSLRVLVLDEADRLLDPGSIDEVREVVLSCPATAQRALFSATFPPEVGQHADAVQRAPVWVQVATEVDPGLLRQVVVACEPAQRAGVVAGLLEAQRPDAALVFCHTREDCERLGAALHGLGAACAVLHGERSQEERDLVVQQILHGSVRVVVATDLAARGLDLPALPLVIVAELSPDPVQHVHRAGRTARAGAEGLVICVVAGPVEQDRLARLEAHLGRALERREPPPPVERLRSLGASHRTVVLAVGRADKVRKGDLLGALHKDGGLPEGSVGRIDIGERRSAVAVRPGSVADALRFLRKGKVKGQRVKAWLAGEG